MNPSSSVMESVHSLEYVRHLYADVLGWYHNADTKAQILLTLDGAFLTFVATALLQNMAVVCKLPGYMFIGMGSMALTLTLSIYHAIACIWSRIYRTNDLDQIIRQAGVDRANHDTYVPQVSWFFQVISALDKKEFEKRMRIVEAAFEIEALASQIHILSGNVRQKHIHVNQGFVFAALTLVVFLLSALSVVLFATVV